MNADEFREVGHRVVDLLAGYLEDIEEKPVFPDVEPAALTRLFAEPLPRDSTSAENVISELEQKLLPNCTHVGHPGYMGLITPSPSPIGIIADFICSGLNQNIGTYTLGPAAVAMERRTVRWLTSLVGYDANAGGNLTSGGMMANFVGLKLARDSVSGDRVQREGVGGRWAVYTSEQRHVSVDKAVDALGLGREALRALPTDAEFRVRLDALEAAIAEDRERGVRPLCIVGISERRTREQWIRCASCEAIADREGMWLHVDAAYGGGMLLSAAWPMRNQGWNWRILSPSTLTNGSSRPLMRARSWSKMIAD